MTLRSLTATAALALMPLLSQAGVVYEWKGLNNETPRGIALTLEFEDRIVESGSFSFNIDKEESPHGGPRPGLGLIALNYSFPYSSTHRTGIYYGQDRGFGHDGPFLPYGLKLNMDLTFERGGFLAGFIHVMDMESGFTMQSGQRIFTVTYANSEVGMVNAGCGFGTASPCHGATGFIRRVNDVPEPGSLALIGAGVLAASSIRRKKLPKSFNAVNG